MFYCWFLDTFEQNVEIGLATSTDGINWTKYADNPIIPVGAGEAFDSMYIRHPNP